MGRGTGAVDERLEHMGMSQTDRVTLPCDAQSVRRARQLVRTTLSSHGAEHFVDDAELAVSEIVTNAVVHAGTPVELYVGAARGGVRVEVLDGSPSEPMRRTFAPTAATGRGMQLLEECVDRWGIIPGEGCKTVWFELGAPERNADASVPGPPESHEPSGTLTVELRRMPLLMHWAWQEHASSLLRDYLLFALEDDPDVLQRHAQAGGALSLLAEQVPLPALPDDPDALLAGAVEPKVSTPRVELRLPPESLDCFRTLDAMLRDAIAAAGDGHLLTAPTQPEIGEMRAWVCDQVLQQAAGAAPQPWSVDLDPRRAVTDSTLPGARAELGSLPEALVATDEACVVVAVTPPALELLGYADEDELLGRRVLAIIPPRFHQAHVAGATLHHAHGRSTLLDVPVTVPVLRADDTELPVRLTVSAEGLSSGERVFVARLQPAD